MRYFSDNVKFLLQQDNVDLFYLVSLTTKDGLFLYTTASNNITFDGDTYIADSGLVIVDAPRLSTSIDREVYRITFADPEFEKRELFENVLTGAPAKVMVGFFNTSNIVVGGVNPGQPLLDPDDVILAYGGVVDTQGYAIAPAEGTIMAAIECASPVANLGAVNAFYTSKSHMREINPSDTSFDRASVGSAKVAFLWGKA